MAWRQEQWQQGWQVIDGDKGDGDGDGDDVGDVGSSFSTSLSTRVLRLVVKELLPKV
jgi:hypothetical protein